MCDKGAPGMSLVDMIPVRAYSPVYDIPFDNERSIHPINAT